MSLKNTFKRIACGVLAGAMVITGAAGLTTVNAQAATKSVKITDAKVKKLEKALSRKSISGTYTVYGTDQTVKVPFETDTKKGLAYFDFSNLDLSKASTTGAASMITSIGGTYVDTTNKYLYMNVNSLLWVKADLAKIETALSAADTTGTAGSTITDDQTAAITEKVAALVNEYKDTEGVKKGNTETYTYDGITAEKLGLSDVLSNTAATDAEAAEAANATYKVVVTFNTKGGAFTPTKLTVYANDQKVLAYTGLKFSSKTLKNIKNFSSATKDATDMTDTVISAISSFLANASTTPAAA